jgi:DNA-binding FadR family transcriptional regulator
MAARRRVRARSRELCDDKAPRGRGHGVSTLKLVSAKPQNERVTHEIGLRILAGTYRPGDTIPPEMRFCAELGVSRTALREAIKQLSSKGLVTPRVKLGTVVNPRAEWNFFDPMVLEWLLLVEDIGPFLVKLFEFRKAVEPGAAAMAAQHATPEQRAELRRSFAAMVEAVDDFDAWIAADLRFHQVIYAATGNEFFWPVGRLLEPAFVAGFRVTSSVEHHQHCVPEHRAVHDAILARDPPRAYQAVIDLMKTSDSDLSQMLGFSAIPKRV